MFNKRRRAKRKSALGGWLLLPAIALLGVPIGLIGAGLQGFIYGTGEPLWLVPLGVASAFLIYFLIRFLF